MAELNIRERQAGDVSVLDLNGEIRIGDSAVGLRGAIRELVAAGKKKVILNLAEVRYIDSSGIGEISANTTTLGRMGGALRIAHLTDKVQDLLVITKLLSAFDCYDTVEEALDSFDAEKLYVRCPVHGCDNFISFTGRKGITIDCRQCGAKFFTKERSSGDKAGISINSVRLPTYDSEYIDITPGAPTIVKVVGRLDLFASEVLERAWLTVPSPRQVIFRFARHTEITEPGVQKLIALCGSNELDSKAVILTTSKKAKSLLSTKVAIYEEKRRAIAAVGPLPPSAQWILTIHRQPISSKRI